MVYYFVEQINEKSEKSKFFLFRENMAMMQLGDSVSIGDQLFIVVLLTNLRKHRMTAICHESFQKRGVIDDEMDLI